MKKNIIVVMMVSMIIFSGCYKDYELERSIYIHDSEYHELPQYSEWGYNTFGAYIDRKVFKSGDYEIPAKIIANADTLSLQLIGMENFEKTIIQFSFVGYSPDNHSDLVTLKDMRFNLNGENCFVTFIKNDTTQILRLIEGEFYFKNVQNVFVDEELIQTVLSGYFDFKAFIGQDPVTISNGRFDVGIGYDNFYKY